MPKTKAQTVLVLKATDSDFFEEAHLILKDKYEVKHPSLSMVEEANRIIQNAEQRQAELCPQKKPSGSVEPRLRWFLSGALFGMIACCLGAFVLSLLI